MKTATAKMQGRWIAFAGLAAVLAVWALTQTAYASTWTTNLPVCQANFNADTVGSPPSTAPLVINTTGDKPSYFYADANNTVTVVASAGGLNDQPVRLTSTVLDGLPSLNFDGGDNLFTSGGVHVRWDSSVISGGAIGEKVFEQAFRSNGAGFLFSVTYQRGSASGGNFVLDFLGNNTSYGSWTDNVPNHFAVDLNLDAQTVTVVANGTVLTLNQPKAMPQFRIFSFADTAGLGGSSPAFDAAVDNIYIAPFVPEPSVAVLLGVGSLLVWRRRKKLE